MMVVKEGRKIQKHYFKKWDRWFKNILLLSLLLAIVALIFWDVEIIRILIAYIILLIFIPIMIVLTCLDIWNDLKTQKKTKQENHLKSSKNHNNKTITTRKQKITKHSINLSDKTLLTKIVKLTMINILTRCRVINSFFISSPNGYQSFFLNNLLSKSSRMWLI